MLFIFGCFAHEQAAVQRRAIMGIKLVFDGGLPLCDLPIGVYRELCITAFTNSQYGEIGEPLDDSQLALHKHQFPTVPKPLTSPVDFK
jgi:hypothetical protein